MLPRFTGASFTARLVISYSIMELTVKGVLELLHKDDSFMIS